MKKAIITAMTILGLTTIAQAKEINLGCETIRAKGTPFQWDLYLNTDKMTGTKSDVKNRGDLAIQSDAYVLVMRTDKFGGFQRIDINRADLSVNEHIVIDIGIGDPIKSDFQGKCVVKQSPKNQI